MSPDAVMAAKADQSDAANNPANPANKGAGTPQASTVTPAAPAQFSAGEIRQTQSPDEVGEDTDMQKGGKANTFQNPVWDDASSFLASSIVHLPAGSKFKWDDLLAKYPNQGDLPADANSRYAIYQDAQRKWDQMAPPVAPSQLAAPGSWPGRTNELNQFGGVRNDFGILDPRSKAAAVQPGTAQKYPTQWWNYQNLAKEPEKPAPGDKALGEKVEPSGQIGQTESPKASLPYVADPKHKEDVDKKLSQAAAGMDSNSWMQYLSKLSGDVLDAFGVANAAYGGVQRQTRLQQEFSNRLVMEQQRAMYKSAAEAEISKMNPQLQADIQRINAEYAANGDMQKAVRDYTYMMDKGLIDEQQYTNFLRALVGPGFMGAGGGSRAATAALQAPGAANPAR